MSTEWLKNPATGALAIVAVFGAVGVVGDFLPRLVRNDPWPTAVFVLFALASVFVLLIPSSWVRGFGSLLLLVSLAGIAILGVVSLSDRETPQVTLSSTLNDARTTGTIELKATAASLRSQETMQIQVVAFVDRPGPEALREECTSSRIQDDVEKPNLIVLYWDETGPDTDGTSSVETSLDVVPDRFSMICVGVFLRDRDEGTTNDDRKAWAYTPLA